MNDDLHLNRQQLDAATARSLPANVALDHETSALRDGFVALGRAVEAAAANYDEAALIARVQATCIEQSAPVLPSYSAARFWPLVLSGVLAASSLVAIVRIAISWPRGEMVVVAPVAPAENNDESFDSSQNQLDPQVPSPSAVAWDAWDDPLDEEIAAAQSSLTNLSGSAVGIDGALSNIHQSLEAMSDDLFDESL